MRSISHYYELVKKMNKKDFVMSMEVMLNAIILQDINNRMLDRRSKLSQVLVNSRFISLLNNPTGESFSDLCSRSVPNEQLDDLSNCCQMYLEHKFDLLGSGWVYNRFKNEADGFEGYRYDSLTLERDPEECWLKLVLNPIDYKSARDIYELISKDYIPIDWQKDYKSGYRWSAKDYARPVKYIDADVTPGVDIKVPWELGRLQHLTRLAFLYCVVSKDNDFRNRLAKEYHDQLLDFIAQNPPGRGVNWGCTMDVGIRTANIALSYSLMRTAEWEPEDKGRFESIINNSIFQHCRFIRRNLEWSNTCRSNHYLSDVCGLLFGSSALSDIKVCRKWIRFATSEILSEIKQQFHEDGTDFEGSVGYHRLSSELVTFSLALINRLSSMGYCKCADKEIIKRIVLAGSFARDTVLPDNTFYQCGDNDSGRFIPITPILKNNSHDSGFNTCDTKENPSFYESVNRPDALISAINSLTGTDIPVNTICYAEKLVIDGLVGFESPKVITGHIIQENERETTCSLLDCILNNKELKDVDEIFDIEAYSYNSVECEKFERPVSGEMIYREYPDFGLSVIRAQDFFLGICWSDNGQNGNAGHTHNDKLSYEMWIEGKPIVRDPGTYVYTPIPTIRNELRSGNAHSIMHTTEEQNRYINLFAMHNDTHVRIFRRKVTKDYIELGYILTYRDVSQARIFNLHRNGLEIYNYSNVPFTTDHKKSLMTEGYGRLVKNEA